ncbi:MAG: GNAT family N-acetyltransferase, partial [Chloroflexi bacterium]|nr:GNAT family N-acetyltransferase [Chloroflexota bacterium]
EYKAAALGNISTHPDHRNQGIGTIVTAALRKKLLGTVDTIGLNVKSDNAAAITTYKKLGFEVVATYHE